MMRRLLAAALAALAGCGSEPGPGRPESAGPPEALFREAAAETGLAFQHFGGAAGEFRLPEIMGSGVALLDYDQDGDLDVYLLQGTPPEEGGARETDRVQAPGGPGNRLFENRIVPTGTLAFVDATEAAGLSFAGYGMGVAVGDYDADGNPDLYLANLGPNALFRNGGDGAFERVAGPQDPRWSTSASFVDYDADGDLDLFLANYVDYTARNNKQCFAPTGARDYCNPTVYNPVPDRLFRNDGGRFVDVSAAAGLGTAFGNGLGIATADLNNDRLPDLYVANDGTDNQLWINLGGGRFENRALLAGAAVNADGRPEAGMGVIAADFDNDGDDDLLLTHNTLETNTLYLNDGQGGFRDATNRLGLGAPSMPFTGFGLAWADFDHDGGLDAFVANGAVTVMEALRGQPHPFRQENQFFRAAGSRFEVLAGAQAWGELAPLASRGAATGDLDLDGDPDVVVSNNHGPARLYLNQTDGERWLRIKLAGKPGNRRGIGARVGLIFEDGAVAWRRLHRDGSYLSSSEPAAHFGLGGDRVPQWAEVRWSGGARERFPVPATGVTLTLEEGTGEPGTR